MARTNAPAPASKATADVLVRLEGEHREVDALFEELGRAKGPAARVLAFTGLRDALTAHAASEEALFYRALRTSLSTEGHVGVSRAFEEHHAIKDWLAQLGATSPDSPAFMARAAQLQAEVKRHVLEEESVLFPLARKVLGAERLKALGERMDAARPSQEDSDRT